MIPYHYQLWNSTIWGENPTSNTQNTITMVELFDATVVWLWQIIQYPRGSIFGRGWLRAWCLVNSLIYFNEFHLFDLYRCRHGGIKPPPVLPPGRTSSPVPTWLCPHVFGWLLCPFVVWWPTIFYFYIFSVTQFAALHEETTPPHTLCPSHAPSPLSLPLFLLTIGRLLLFLTKWQPPKAKAPLSLWFLMFLVLIPKSREPAIAIANPALDACNRTIGSNGAMIWGRRCPIHGERAKPLDRAAAAHFDCCVLCVCLWLCFVWGGNFWGNWAE